jgi:biotin synthase-like enzyme
MCFMAGANAIFYGDKLLSPAESPCFQNAAHRFDDPHQLPNTRGAVAQRFLKTGDRPRF